MARIVTARTAPPDGRALLAAAMSEDALEEQIREVCAQLRVHRQHEHDSRKSQGGWPDDVLVGPGGILFRECKREGEEPRPDQVVVLDLLAAAGADVGVWRPSDLLSGRVAREIAAIARPRAGAAR